MLRGLQGKPLNAADLKRVMAQRSRENEAHRKYREVRERLLRPRSVAIGQVEDHLPSPRRSQMANTTRFKGHEIEPLCRELEDAAGWTVACNVIIHHVANVTVQLYQSNTVKSTQEEAEEAALRLGMRALHHSPMRR
jgi:hypothetical protein